MTQFATDATHFKSIKLDDSNIDDNQVWVYDDGTTTYTLEYGVFTSAFPTTGDAYKLLRVKSDETGYELWTPLGTANQVLGTNATADAPEQKTFVSTANQFTFTHGVGTITGSTPQDLDTACDFECNAVYATTEVEADSLIALSDATLETLTLGAENGILIAASGVVSATSSSTALHYFRRNATNDGYEFATVGGSDTELLYMNGSEIGGDSDLTWDDTGKKLRVNGDIGVDVAPTAYLHVAAGTTSKAPLKFEAGTALSSPVAGAIEFNSDKFSITNVGTQRAIDRTSDVVTSTTSVSNTTDETTIFTGTIGANDLKAGNVVKMSATGVYTVDDASNQVTLKVKLGSTTLQTFAIPTGIVTDEPWCATLVMTVRSVGASGSIATAGEVESNGSNTLVGSVETVDTTAAENITITAQWGTADSNDSLSIYQGFLEFKN